MNWSRMRLSVWCGLLPVLVACQPETASLQEAAQLEATSNPEDEAKQRAQMAAKAFSERLQGALRGKMGTEGQVAAIDFCKAEAPAIAAEIAREYGVKIGRIPVHGRARNPENIVDGWQSRVLDDFRSRAANGAAVSELVFVSSEQSREGVALRLMRGIEVQPGCLDCHGKQLAEPVRAALALNYPNDAATGFDAGDLRGALWVEIPANQP